MSLPCCYATRQNISSYFLGCGIAVLVFVSGCGKGDQLSVLERRKVDSAESIPTAVLDLEGKQVDPFGDTNANAVVFAFVSTDCPISNRYAPELQRLQERFGTRGAVFWLVYPNIAESNEGIRSHQTEYRYHFGALRDPEHSLVRKASARVTPEVAVFRKNGELAYHGRIDDRYADLNKERPAPTTHELADVLEAVLSGKPVITTNTPAIGCYIQALK